MKIGSAPLSGGSAKGVLTSLTSGRERTSLRARGARVHRPVSAHSARTSATCEDPGVNFGSDNQSGASAQVLDAVVRAYNGQADPYGLDDLSAAATDALRETFETDLEAFFVASGTAANSLALSAMVEPWDGVICHHQAHILLDESSGPALFTGGAGLLPVPGRQLRLTAEDLNSMLGRLPGDPPHNIRARVLSITQASECGQVYSVAEIEQLTEVARAAGLRVHMDGARFANAVAATGSTPADLTWRAGVDVLCLGATKNGGLLAEAIVFFDTDLAADFDYRMKRSGHLASKGRLFGAQFAAWLKDDHWLDLAHTANAHATALRAGIEDLASPQVRLAFSCQSNETFVVLNRALFTELEQAGAVLYEWYPDAVPPEAEIADDELLARLVTSFATTAAEIEAFLDRCRT